jgi:hypothetical protein
MEAMEKIHTTVADGFHDDGDSKGEFVGDDDFKLEIFSVNVLQVIINAITADKEYPPVFDHWALGILFVFGSNHNKKMATFLSSCVTVDLFRIFPSVEGKFFLPCRVLRMGHQSAQRNR